MKESARFTVATHSRQKLIVVVDRGRGIFRPAMVLFPTPPFADDTAIILVTFGILRLVGKPRWALGMDGEAPFLGRPYTLSFIINDNSHNDLPGDSHGSDISKQY